MSLGFYTVEVRFHPHLSGDEVYIKKGGRLVLDEQEKDAALDIALPALEAYTNRRSRMKAQERPRVSGGSGSRDDWRDKAYRFPSVK